MAKSSKQTAVTRVLVHVKKKTSQGKKRSSLSMTMMNKHKRRTHKAYRGQGK